jgi:hypothetical protein
MHSKTTQLAQRKVVQTPSSGHFCRSLQRTWRIAILQPFLAAFYLIFERERKLLSGETYYIINNIGTGGGVHTPQKKNIIDDDEEDKKKKKKTEKKKRIRRRRSSSRIRIILYVYNYRGNGTCTWYRTILFVLLLSNLNYYNNISTF